MWEALSMHPRGRLSARKFIVLFATCLVVLLSYFVIAAPTASAADASWRGDNIVYNGDSYTGPSNKSGKQGLGNLPSPVQIYEYREGNTANLIYFSGGVPKSEEEATYITYTLNPPNQYSNPSATQTISLEPATAGAPAGTSEGTGSKCEVDGIGWVICPLGNAIAVAVDKIYDVIAGFLEVQPITGGNNSLYRLWDVFRDIANVLFAIGFLVVIYSYLAGGVGGDSYGLRRIIPRVFMAAILVNISYWICSVAVDISNILGASIQGLFESIRETAIGTEYNTNFGWSDVSNYIYSGGALAIAGIGFTAAAGGSIASFAFILIGLIIPVAFAAFIALVVLAARQAIIVVLVIISPLAFAAYILPNTEKWFERWRSLFLTMLLVFPIFSVLFGGSQLAAVAIMQNASSIAVLLLGLTVQIVPLVITPLLIQFSGSLIGRIAGIANSSSKGLVDRSRNWANDRAEFHKQRNLAQPNKKWNRANVARRSAQRMYAKKMSREKQLEAYKKDAEDLAHRREYGQGPIASSVLPTSARNFLNRNSYAKADQRYREADQRHRETEAEHDYHWKDRMRMFDTDGNWNSHFDQSTFDREVAIRGLGDKSKRADDNLEKNYAAMKAGYNAYNAAGYRGPADEETQLKIDDIAATARDIRIEGEALKSVQLVDSSKFANELKVDASLRAQAASIDFETGDKRVLASAKAAVTKEFLEAADNIQNTMEYDKQSNLERLGAEFNDSLSTEEKIAHARLLTKSGPGLEILTERLAEWTRGKDPLTEEVMMVKEILAADQTFRNASRSNEVWANNETKKVTGPDGVERRVLYDNFEDVHDNVGVWRNIAGQRFASMKEPAQKHALNLLRSQPNGAAEVRKFAERMLIDQSVRGAVKGKPLDMLMNARDGVSNLEADREDTPPPDEEEQ